MVKDFNSLSFRKRMVITKIFQQLKYWSYRFQGYNIDIYPNGMGT